MDAVMLRGDIKQMKALVVVKSMGFVRKHTWG